MESLKISKYFEYVNPAYVNIKIIPHKSIRNYNSSNIAKTIGYTYKKLEQRIRIQQKKLFFDTKFKISYIMDISNADCNFYFIIPNIYKTLLLDKITEIWKQATIEEVETIPDLKNEETITYSLFYKKDDGLSLNVNKANNEPLNSIMNVIDIMKDNDKIRIAYNFMPINQNGWKQRYEDMENKVKNHRLLEKSNTSFRYILKQSLMCIFSIFDCIFDILRDCIGVDNKKTDTETIYNSVMSILQDQKEISSNTKKKKEATIINTQIAVMSQSQDKVRRENNAISVCNAYSVLTEDNELIYKKLNKNKQININDYDYKIKTNLCSSDECQNFIQIPADTLLKEYKIKYIDTTESQVPEELQTGTMCIGVNVCKGKETRAYLSTDIQFRNLPLCIIAPNRSGKTTLLTNLAIDSINGNECSILFDFCGECEFSDIASSAIGFDKVLNIDCSDFEHLQGLGFNEVKPKNDTVFEIYRAAKDQTNMLTSFINSINFESPLEPRMNRYLKAAALTVFICKGSIKDVFKVLQNHLVRKKIIDSIPANQLENMDEYITTLEELDEYGKGKEADLIVGTKISFVQGILNRVDLITSNAYMELMLKKDCSKNIDLVEEMQKNQLICLKIPETMFSTDVEKDVYCTYWVNKIWGALQQRHAKLKEPERTKVNIFVDELYQVPCCQTFLKTVINQIAKKTAKIIVSGHSLHQLRYIKPELTNASTSYMLIAGCTKDNYKDLKEELDPYVLDDLLALKRYTSLNIIKTNDGYAKFITKLPNKIK